MKLHNYYICAVAVMALLTAACNEDALDIPQQGVVSEDNYYQTDEEAEAAVTNTYSIWRQAYSGYSGNYGMPDLNCNGFCVKNLMADDVLQGGNRSDNAGMDELYESVVTPTNVWVDYYYQKLYKIIYSANLVLGRVDETSATKQRCRAEARCLRAWSYIELVSLWGPVPMVDHVLSPDEYQITNSTVAELWAFVESDLLTAIESGCLVSKTGIDDADTGSHFSREAALTLLGKAYLYQGKYDQAYTQLKAVYTSGLYGLIDDLNLLYHMDANGCREYVLENVRHLDYNNLWCQYGWLGMYGNWRLGSDFVAGPEAYNYFDFNATGGYAYYNPSKKLYDAFVAEEGKDGYRLNAAIKTFDQLVGMNIYCSASSSSFAHEGYFRMKWLTCQRDENFSWWYFGQFANTPVIRYADVLLMLAEAAVQTGDQTTADQCVNLVRRRAHLADKSNVTLADVKTERELELCMEGVRYQDLVRWGDAAAELADKAKRLPTFVVTPLEGNDYSTAEGIYNAKYKTEVTYIDNERELAGWTAGRDEYLPFPEAETEVNKALKQNPGY